MKIWSDIPKVSGVYDNNRNIRKIEKASGVASKKDVVSISSEARDSQTIMKGLRETPDIRANKVNDLTTMLESGNYDVNAKDIADKIVKSVFDYKA